MEKMNFNIGRTQYGYQYNHMTTPFVFAFNLRRSIFQMFGLSLFRQIPNIVMQNGTKIHLLPIVNNLEYYIEERAQSISKLLPKLLHANQIEKCHLIGYSLSGIDARFAISKFGMDKYTKSLTTIATPHLGCKLAWLAERQVFSDKKVEPIARLLGVGLRPFYEVNKENMKHINKDVANIPEVEYFSIGAERLPNNMTIQLRETGNHLRTTTEHNFVYENDGVVGHDECQWGQHLVNFQADHSEIVGINPYDQLQNVFRLIEDNVAYNVEDSAKN